MSRKRFFHLCLVTTIIMAGLAVPLVQPSVAFAASPDTPSNVSPSDNATGISLTPTLVASGFVDSDNSSMHIASQWEVDDVQGDFNGPNDWESGTDLVNLENVTVDTALADSTTYWWRVRYFDSGGEWSEWSTETSFTTLDATAPLISDVAATGITATSATITWTTDEPATSQVEYSVDTSYNLPTPLDTNLVISHSVDLTGLAPGTTYHYRVNSADASDNPAQSGDNTFTTVDATAPVISNVTATSIAATSATITWTTDEPATSQVEYSVDTSYNLATPLDTNLVISHSVDLTDLAPGTTYHYRVNSADASGNPATSGDYTLDTSDIGAPVISDVTATNITATGATITWTTDELATSQVEYSVDTSYNLATPLDTNLVTSHSVNLTGLTPGTTYHYRVNSADASGNPATSGDYTLDTSDIGAPVISNVSATDITAASATITWTTDERATSRVEYGLDTKYGSSTILDGNLVTSHSVNLTGLISETTYHYRVISEDSWRNWTVSGDYTFTTSDVTGPVISGLTATDVTATSATITWTTNEAATSQIEYGLTEAYGSSTAVDTNLVTSHSVNLTGLKAPKTYHYRVNSADGSGNPAISADNTFTTTDDTAPSKPVVTDDGATTTSLTELHATWTSSDPQSGIVEYQYAIGTTAGGTDAVSWTSVGTNTEVTRTGLTLAWGTAYYFSVKAKNGQGAWSSVGSSNGIQVTDATPPSTPVVTDDGGSTTSTTQLHATWTCNDPESGIEKYQYAIGATAGGTDVVGWTSVGVSDGVTRTGLKLTVGVTYYFSVRAKNADGLLSGVGVSDGILVAPQGTGQGDISAAGGTVQTGDGKITAVFPADAVVGTVTVSIEQIAPPSYASPPEGFKAVNAYFIIEVIDVDGKAVVTFSRSIAITVKYSEADVAAAGGDPDNLVLAYWDGAAGEWKVLETKVNTASMTLGASTTHLSTWAVLARTTPASSGGLPPLVWLLGLIGVVAVVVPAALILARKRFYLQD